ncbi:MAG TPA: nickel-dependent hydrogenase large subunit [Levilinea sp.]|nr:nickel-dependent hydrogenase large subunit [Levilinea sp.]
MSWKDNSDRFIVPIGPQHPALKEPGHFEFTIDGEIVTGASLRLGFVHRGIEKATENRSWIQNLYLLERVCGICSHIHSTTYANGVEKLAGVVIPPRAQVIRTILCEMERIHSHLLWLGVAAHEGGFDTLFMYSWRDRETIMDLLESISGNRVNYSANVLGGVKFDLTQQQAGDILRGLDFLEARTHHYLDIVTTDETFLGRTRGVGIMTAEQIEKLGAVGPTARASGVARDVRVDAPYLTYTDFMVNIKLAQAGDLEARFIVRINELFESYRLIRAMLADMPESELTTRVPRHIPAGEVISRAEAPRGELFYFIKSGGDKPERIKIRTPSLCNWGTVITAAVGLKLADMPMLLSGIDPCFSCNDRMVRVRQGPSELTWTWEELRQYGIAYYR